MIRRAEDDEGTGREAALRAMTNPQLERSMSVMLQLSRTQAGEALRATEQVITELSGEMARRLTTVDFGVWYELD